MLHDDLQQIKVFVVADAWLFLFYKAPSQPSSARVTAWRRLHRSGAVFLGPSSCAVPARLEVGRELERIVTDLRAAGGSSELFRVDQMSRESEQRLVELYNAARDAEYGELIEQAEAVVEELKREGARQKFTFAEVEENEADLTKLRRWLSRIRWRDLFEASGRARAEAAVRRAQEQLDEFARIATERDSEGAGSDRQPR
jgi:hypothetical protein